MAERTRLRRLLDRLVESLPSGIVERLARGVEDTIKHGDPSMIYHRLSMLTPDYYGGSLSPPRVDPYYKRIEGARRVRLPRPRRLSGVDVFEAIRSRRSRREYSSRPLGLGDLATLLYYSVGVTGRAWWGGPKRAYPSAGGLQPVEAYVAASRVEGVEPGIYHYNPGEHLLAELSRGDYSRVLEEIALDQEHVGRAPAVLVLTAVYARTAGKYGYRSYRYVHWDTGFAGENVYLAAEALGLATVAVGAFHDEELCRLLGLDCVWEFPMLLFPVGYRV